MDGLSACMIDTRIVYGFQGAGKTYYIRDCIMNDYFYKYGTTLILCFEQGKETYDIEMLREKNTYVAVYDSGMDIREFCLDPIRKYGPDRIYVEMNTKIPLLRNSLPEIMNVTSAVTLIEWQTMDLAFPGYRQTISQMVMESQQVTFRGCTSKDMLAPYSQEFKLMNHRASYLRQDPMGYHEKAFDLFVPYSLDDDMISISDKEYIVFWLDAADHPEHYEGKKICFSDPLELRHITDDSSWSAGRVVMTCCMSDLQFMSFELTGSETADITGGWITMKAFGRVSKDKYGRKILKLEPEMITGASASKSNILMPGTRSLNQPASRLISRMIRV